MKTKLPLIILIFALNSCNLVKRTAETTSKSEHKEETVVSKTIDESKDQKKDSTANTETKTHTYATKEQIAKMVAEWSENVVTYDTSKPVDKITGKPPVLSEKTICYKSDIQTNEDTKVNSVVAKNEKVNLQVETKDETKTKLDSTHKSSNKENSTSKTIVGTSVPWWKWLLCGIALSAVVILTLKLRSIFKL